MKSHLPLLIEILTEELPALPLLKELPHIIQKWQSIAKKHNVSSTPTLYYTPRRLVLYEEGFLAHTPDSLIESYGPPLSIAYIDGDKTKGLSKAGESFYKKNNLPLEQELETRIKDNKEVLYYAITQKGVETSSLLESMVVEWLHSLQFGKSMFWGDVEQGFIRPVRNILILLGEQSICVNAFNRHFGKQAQTFVHRDVSFEPFKITSIEQYFDTLQKNFVILSQDKRKELILSQIAELESAHKIQVEIDTDLLNEIVAITEYPQAAYGSFDSSFLALPSEVIITSMKENQRYFATYKDSVLHNGFVLVSNSTAKDLSPIVQGNQKVLKARLADAMFFYENDLKKGFTPELLEQIVFVENLGSLLDKSKRESALANALLESFAPALDSIDMPKDEARQILTQATKYAKADLLTEMVYEFTELQGVMGYYYAKNFCFHPLVALAIKEQYLPTGEDSALPSHILSAILALSIKLDNIFALFSIDKIPSGSKDPFALRRAANGVIKIINHYDLDFDLLSDMPRLYQAGGYKISDMKRIEQFFIERLEGALKINLSIIRSVLKARVNNKRVLNLKNIIRNAKALNAFFEKSDKQALVSLFRRVANILSDEIKPTHIDESLLKLPQEIALFQALKSLKSQALTADVDSQITALFSLKEPLEAFFNSVLVNDENNAIKTNRQMLVFSVHSEFLRIGDMREITL
ncbi:glycyl-tRNA synthetase subunit beta [Helicobacter cinaedi PAGU611]|uniref:glycine--tRNA ligase subunit beta n=1 Tax=Helicobacter cinaedi TaxID=213 RepID=UPI00025D32ED|nr:glycine--tRNA ligase subunit beta [Helicobacter cinaedi]AWK60979.1 glycine--tRNA ligase subunit beta [Helicobacter cinaedi]QOQ96626.1 glycine--tRNA ligase subunit beta [Helicobacter cinaedi]BAM11444.1 glycyl-tRNA synthetase subunit beta [Helicobacter cinaedi PAGU611]BBB18946.1 glycyl-tRNA synthetase beta chain [Helicobacter cinaedi]